MSDEVKKAREFWLDEIEGTYTERAAESEYERREWIHVIEHSAYTDLLREAMKLREVLESSKGWVITHAMQTYSSVARNEAVNINKACENFDNFLKDREGK